MPHNPTSISSFRDELIKIAVTIEGLRAGLRRVGGRLKVPFKKSYISPGTSQFASAAALGKKPPLKATVSAMGAGLFPPRKKTLELVRRVAPEAPTEEVKKLLPSKRLQGKIFEPSVGGFTGWARANPDLRGLGRPTGRAAKGVNVAIPMHESLERQVASKIKTKDYPRTVFHGHASPEVIMKEHNLVRSLEGPGAKGTKEYFKNLRSSQVQPDAPVLKKLLEKEYGPRVGFEYGRSGKIPKAMQKDFMRKVRSGRIEVPNMPSME